MVTIVHVVDETERSVLADREVVIAGFGAGWSSGPNAAEVRHQPALDTPEVSAHAYDSSTVALSRKPTFGVNQSFA